MLRRRRIGTIGAIVTGELDPSNVAARVLSAICEGEFYVFTHPQMRGDAEEQFAAILAALDKAAALKGLHK